jgi:hypothetical protein
VGHLFIFALWEISLNINRSVVEIGEAWDGGPHHYADVDKVSDTRHLTLYHSASRFFEGPQSLILRD